MKKYIEPSTDIIATQMHILDGISTHKEVGDGNEFANTTTFEQEITTPKQSLWED